MLFWLEGAKVYEDEVDNYDSVDIIECETKEGVSMEFVPRESNLYLVKLLGKIMYVDMLTTSLRL